MNAKMPPKNKKINIMKNVGIPTEILPSDIKSNSLTTWPSWYTQETNS